jgi:uncharacterized protein
VIIDAVSLNEDERHSFASIAKQAGVPFSGIWLSAPADVMVARLRDRHNHASDASVEVLKQQLRRDPGPLDWQRVNVGGDRDTNLAAVRNALQLR